MVQLTRQEGVLMTAFLAHREITSDLLVEVLWPDPDRMPDCWLGAMKDCLKRLRRKLAFFNMTIVNRRGFGWRLADLDH